MSDPLSRLQLRHYRLIHAIAETGQLSLAADRLAISQPAASRMLGEVERDLHAEVFERHPKGMRPTPIGGVLARRAGALLSDLEVTALEVQAFRAGRSGTVRVGAVTGAAVGLVVPALRRLREDVSDADVHVQVGPSVQLMAALTEDKRDFVLCRVPPDADMREFDVLGRRAEETRLVVRAGHPLSAAGPLPYAAIAGFAWVVQARGTPLREAFQAALRDARVAQPSEVINTTSLLVTIACLHSTDAIAPVSREVAQVICGPAPDGLRTLPMATPVEMPPYHLIRRKDRQISPLAERLLGIIRQALT
ncbi:LysR family transcriptional regulator [Roseisalinus antarcticus]|uniref:HTH-type transcriptional regulator GbpR n=1 Tax=Roseisalinus antarcticus TaxID=254357 RepID=A0A1Y5TNV9_9RHOB|nr:LysR family transcriptional regulator [Roseisalinus antarcticus]SLN68083.1 HTH-type transcriptional regulator GbpR [Roseisalinus antarcticus]